jgi:cold shock CspA family protein
METPAEIDFLGGKPPAAIRDAIDAHVAALEKRFGRITACRVAVRQPTGHHHTGGLHEVSVHLALPDGRDVNIDRIAQDDERLADAAFAVNHAFKRARRVLQDRVRRMQGKVKTHEPEPIGTVTRLDASGGFGFLETADGREVYFHRNSVLNDAFAELVAGSRVAFFEEQGDKGPQASTVKIVGKHSLR